MTEILTESFCERCGTRYTFEVARPQTSRIVRVRAFTKGVRNFVLSDDSSFSEAMAEARGEEERAATSLQLDEFHKTFNFCLSCRQYTCGNCWNDVEGRCLSCAPVPEAEELAPPAVEAVMAVEPLVEAPAPIEASAWPTVDLPPAPVPADVVEPAVAEPAPTAAFEAEAAAAVEVEAVEPAVAEPAPTAAFEAEAAAAVEVETPVPAAALDVEPPGQVLAGMAPGESLEEAIAAYEAAQLLEAPAGTIPVAAPGEPAVVAEPAVSAEPPVAAEPVAAVEATVESVAVEPVVAFRDEPADTVEPLVAAVAAEAQDEAGAPPVAAEVYVAAEPVAPPPEPVFEPAAVAVEPVAVEPPAPPTVLEPVPMAPEPALPAAAVAEPVPPPAPTPSVPDSGWLTVAPDDGRAPSWPTAPAWPLQAPRRDAPATLAGRPMIPQGDSSLLWAASAREVMAGGLSGAPQPASSQVATAAPQPCVGCGLPLSASARFCRRCGTRQG